MLSHKEMHLIQFLSDNDLYFISSVILFLFIFAMPFSINFDNVVCLPHIFCCGGGNEFLIKMIKYENGEKPYLSFTYIECSL